MAQAHTYGANDPRTNQQNARMHVLLGKLDIDSDQRHELVYQFTQGRTNSSREMLAHECNSLIHTLEQQLDDTEGDKLYRMRRKVFSLAHELGWELINGKVDRERLDFWCSKYGKFHKALMEHTVPELRSLITQLELVNSKAHG
ncbi:MAG: hypothetical protein ABI432_08730 [Flavobacteriales bacterium]